MSMAKPNARRKLQFACRFASLAVRVVVGLLVVHVTVGHANELPREAEALHAGLSLAARGGFPQDDWTDDHWAEGFHLPDLDGPVYAMAVLDGRLYVGGSFSRAGTAEARNIASWDGTSWSALGSGVLYKEDLFYRGQVSALVIFNGELIVGGFFDDAGGWQAHNVARWDGRAWHPMGDGVPGNVNDLTIHDGQIIAGGRFDGFQSDPGSFGLAVWGGASWELEGRFGVPQGNRRVEALATYDQVLVACGEFDSLGSVTARNVVQWDGSSFAALGSGIEGTLTSLAIYKGDLVAGGYHLGPQPVMARWNGSSWAEFTSGLENAGTFSLAVIGGILHAGLAPRGVSQWDGRTWSPVGALTDGIVYSLTEYADALHIGGDFNAIGSQTARSIARWTGEAWACPLDSGQGLGRAGRVRALVNFKDDLIAGGDFTTAGNVVAHCIARWDGQSWHSLNSDPPPYPERLEIDALAVHEGRLIAAGAFEHIGGVKAYNIAGWDGNAWHPIGDGLPSQVSHLLVHDGLLIASAGFGQVMAWDGQSWVQVGQTLGGWVSALADHRGDLVVAVDDNSDEVATVVRLDGEVWTPLPGLTSASRPAAVWSLITFGDHLIASGHFNRAGEHDAGGIAAWDGTSWQPLSPSDPFPIFSSSAMAVYDDRLVISNGPQAWDGGRWTALGSGTSSAYALAAHEGSLFVGGDFSHAGGKAASHISQWTHRDLSAPSLTLGIVQNPYLTENLSLYVIGSESLTPSSMDFRVGDENVPISLIDATASVWRARYRLSGATDSLTIRACAADVSGNDSCVSVTFAAGRITSLSGGTITSVDGRCSLIVDAGALERDAYVLVLPGRAIRAGNEGDHWFLPAGEAVNKETAYTLSSAHVDFSTDAQITIRLDEGMVLGANPDQLCIELLDVGPLESFVDQMREEISARVSRLGTFRLVARGSSSGEMAQAPELLVVPNHPNPARPSTTIAFEVRKRQRARVTLYDVTGRQVAMLFDDLVSPGVTEVRWDGRMDHGGSAPSGIYFYSVQTDHGRVSRKLLVAR